MASPNRDLPPKKSFAYLRSTTPTPADPHSLRNLSGGAVVHSEPSLAPSTEKSGLGIVGMNDADSGLGGGISGGAVVSNGENGKGGKGLAKFFQWGRRSASANTPLTSRQISAPLPATLSILTTTSLPLGFPSPPSSFHQIPVSASSGSSSSRQFMPPSHRLQTSEPRAYSPPSAPPPFPLPIPAQQHPTACIAPHFVRPGIHSVSTMSTMTSTSSFAASSLADDWDSDATSLSSTPESSPGYQKDGTPYQHRMWKVQGLSSVMEDDDEQQVEVISRSRSRNSISGPPSGLPTVVIDPSTPPRMKRLSDSSTQASPSSPPFDPAYEVAARALRLAIAATPDSPGDADNEDSPPRRRRENTKKTSPDHLALQSWTSRIRIPSIRFEGISMDAVFAEVERKMQANSESGLSAIFGAIVEEKSQSRLYGMHQPDDPSEPTPTSPSTSVHSASSGDSIKSANTARPYFDTAPLNVSPPISLPIGFEPSKNAPLPRRTSSRPTPLNVAAANATAARKSSASPTHSSYSRSATPTPSYTSTMYSPSTYSQSPYIPAPRDTSSSIFSPRNDAFYSPTNYTSRSPALLGEAFCPSPTPSTTSTFRGIDLPEVCVLPPTPTPEDGEWSAPIVYNGAAKSSTRVVVLEEKRTVKMSSRVAPSYRKLEQSRRAFLPHEGASTPPLSPAVSNASTISSSTSESPSSIKFPLSEPRIASKLPYVEEDSEVEAEDALTRMLQKLNAPHTPPRTPSQPFSLTSGAFKLHRKQSHKENERLSSPFDGVASTSYESDDSVSRFGDAPALLSVNKTHALAPSLSPRSVTPMPLRKDLLKTQQSEFNHTGPHSTVILTLTPSSSNSSFDSIDSDSVEGASIGKAYQTIPDSRIIRTISSTSFSNSESYDSLDAQAEEVAVVMMGERISCGYHIGVAM